MLLPSRIYASGILMNLDCHRLGRQVSSLQSPSPTSSCRQETVCIPQASELLESAYLYFIEQFRKVYIGEHAKQVVQQEVRLHSWLTLAFREERKCVYLNILAFEIWGVWTCNNMT